MMWKHVTVCFWALLILALPMLNGCYSICGTVTYLATPFSPDVTLDSDPSGASVYQDDQGKPGAYLGKTPYKIDVKKNNVVYISKPGYIATTHKLGVDSYMGTGGGDLLVCDMLLVVPFIVDIPLMFLSAFVPDKVYVDDYHPVIKLTSEEEAARKLLR